MLVTTAMVGDNLRNEPSDSSASATRNLPWPSLALLPRVLSLPPMTMVGSMLPWVSTVETMEVVVVLPWVPAMAMPYFIRISSASISARGITGIFRRCASRSSGLSGRTAEETTTTCPSSGTLSAAWDGKTVAPIRSRRSVVSDRRRSEPDTRYPRFRSSSAIPLIPMPPMPTKWMGSPFLNIGFPPREAERLADRVERRARAGKGQRRRARPLPRLPVAPQRPQGVPDRLLGGVPFRHPPPRPGGAILLRVAGLVAVRGVRVRDQDARPAEERRLRDGERPRAHQDDVAARKHLPDPVRERERFHGEVLLPDRLRHRVVLPRARLQEEPHRPPFPLRAPGHPQHPRVDRPRPLRPPQGQHREGRFGRERIARRGRGSDDLRPHRVPGDLRSPRREERDGPRETGEHPYGPPGEEPVRPPRDAVLLLQEQGDAEKPRGHRDGDGGVPAHAEN